MNKRERNQLYHRPWTLPIVNHYLELALRERVLRWLAGTETEARVHKDRGKHWARCARGNATMGLDQDEWLAYSKKRIQSLVQKELCKRYLLVDRALRSSHKASAKNNASQRAVDQYDQSIEVKIENGVLTATDTTRKFTKTWNWDLAFPRTWPLGSVEAKAVVDYFHRSRYTVGTGQKPLPVQEPPMKSAEIMEAAPLDGVLP